MSRKALTDSTAVRYNGRVNQEPVRTTQGQDGTRKKAAAAVTLASLVVILACIVLLARKAAHNAYEARFWQDSYEWTVTNR